MPNHNDSDPPCEDRLASSGALDRGALDALDQLAQGTSHDFLAELVEAFREHTATTVEGIRESLASGDPEAVGRAAHELKGSAVTFGASAMVALCIDLEDRASNGRQDDLATLVDDLQDEIERVQHALQEQVESRHSQ